MAILKMKKLRLMAVRSRKDALLKELIRCGCVEFSELEEELSASEFAAFITPEDGNVTALRSQRSSIDHAIALLDSYAPKKSSLLSAMPEMDEAILLNDTGLSGALKIAESIESYDARIKRINAEESRQRSVAESVQPWLDLEMPLNTEGTERCSVLMGTVPAKSDVAAIGEAMAQIDEESDIFLISEDKRSMYVLALCMRPQLSAMQDCLRRFGFTPSALNGMEGTAAECRLKANETLRELAEEKQNCIDYIVAEAVRRDDLKLASDRLGVKIALAEAEDKLCGTESVVIMEGWIPEEREEELALIFDRFGCAWETVEPEEEEYPNVPVELKNNVLTNSLNMVTNMYSLPAYGTVDPNPLMAPFFILFFGLMMADMGYGIIMILAAIVAMAKIKPRGGTLAFCQLLLYCGIATFLMGILTGGLFSDIPYQLVHLINPDSTWPGLWHLFSPEEDSELVLYGAMILGALQLNTGMVVNFVQKCKAGNVAGAIFEEGSLWVILVGGILAILGIGNISGVPVVLIVGIVMLLFGAGRESKGFGKVTAAFGCIYNTATGWFGDVLSYSRIMALMLAGGVIGKVFNTVALMPAKNSGLNAGTIAAAVVIFLVGHAMNFGLNLLGCFVHDLRLQCLEYFGKFFTDGGKPFRPLKIDGKYMRVKE